MDYLKYVDKDSLLHRLDPRTKFAFFIIMSVLTSLVKSGVALLFLLAFFIGLWSICKIGKEISVLLSKLKVLLLFILLLWIVLGAFKPMEVDIGFIIFQKDFPVLNGNTISVCLDWHDFYKGIVYSLRIFIMISSFYTVLLTTNFSEIILGLQKWHIPYAVSFGIGLVFQIIPIIITELQAIMDAQSSRGLEIDKCGWVVKIKNYITFSLPLLFRVISKAQSISLAMHYYQLNFSVKRTAYKLIKTTRHDLYFGIATFIAVAGTVVLRILFYVPV